MAEFLSDPIAVGMTIFGLFLLIGTRWQKCQSNWERKHQSDTNK